MGRPSSSEVPVRAKSLHDSSRDQRSQPGAGVCVQVREVKVLLHLGTDLTLSHPHPYAPNGEGGPTLEKVRTELSHLPHPLLHLLYPSLAQGDPI